MTYPLFLRAVIFFQTPARVIPRWALISSPETKVSELFSRLRIDSGIDERFAG